MKTFSRNTAETTGPPHAKKINLDINLKSFTKLTQALTGVAQLVGHHPTKPRVAGSVLSQGTYERQPINVSLSH